MFLKPIGNQSYYFCPQQSPLECLNILVVCLKSSKINLNKQCLLKVKAAPSLETNKFPLYSDLETIVRLQCVHHHVSVGQTCSPLIFLQFMSRLWCLVHITAVHSPPPHTTHPTAQHSQWWTARTETQEQRINTDGLVDGLVEPTPLEPWRRLSGYTGLMLVGDM